MVVPISRLLREDYGATPAVDGREGLYESTHGFVNQVAMDTAQNRAFVHDCSWQNID
jgi:hypothetical protein